MSKTNNDVSIRENEIKSELRKHLGLRISEPLPAGGNSNDGNTARTFFREYKTVAKITGLNENLLERMHIILILISCRNEIKTEDFKDYAEKTRELYVRLYDWYPLSPTVHKVIAIPVISYYQILFIFLIVIQVLIHSATIIRHMVLPIGMYSEEAQESRNKSIRRYREFFARKFNRVRNIEDVFKRLLLTSDPFLTLKYGKTTRAECNDIPEKAKYFLVS